MTFTVRVGSGVHEPSLNYVAIDSGDLPKIALAFSPPYFVFCLCIYALFLLFSFPWIPNRSLYMTVSSWTWLSDKGVFLLKGSSSSPLFPKALHGASSDCLSFLSNLWCPYLTLWFTKLKHLKATVVNWHYKKKSKDQILFLPTISLLHCSLCEKVQNRSAVQAVPQRKLLYSVRSHPNWQHLQHLGANIYKDQHKQKHKNLPTNWTIADTNKQRTSMQHIRNKDEVLIAQLQLSLPLLVTPGLCWHI